MKKYMPGFVTINYRQSGKILLVGGLACIIAKLISYLPNWFVVPNYFI